MWIWNGGGDTNRAMNTEWIWNGAGDMVWGYEYRMS